MAHSESFKQIYSNNYDAIVADYESGYKYVLFVEQGNYRDYSRSILLSKEPIYVLGESMRNPSGAYADSDSGYHSYLPSGQGWHSSGVYQYFASNYDVSYTDDSYVHKGEVCYNARNLPDWFSVAYADAADCPAAIPVCNLVPDFYKKDGYLAYYYYKDYPEYAFCVASDSELYVIREESDTGQARRFVGRVSDNVIVASRGTNDVMYVYNRKLGTWSEFNNVNKIFWPWGNSSLVTLGHAYDSLNGGNNFTLLGTNKAIRQLDFDSSGASPWSGNPSIS